MGSGNDDARRPGDWGLRVKICVVDWDGDGRLDILLGDRCGGFRGKPNPTDQEKADEQRANDQLPGLRKQWAAAFAEYRRLDESNPDPERDKRLTELRERLRRLKDEIALVQIIQGRFQPGHQIHGFVWLFLRKPISLKAK